MPCAGLGGEVGRYADIGAGPGVPWLGDDVTLGPHAGVLGPVRIGDRVCIPAGLALTQDVEDDAMIEAPRIRILRQKEALL
jgi:serine acetyltransferase